MTIPATLMGTTRTAWLFWPALAVAVGVGLLWPGDASWVNDEPALLFYALQCNQQHRLAEYGLMGTFGVHYGPVVAWLYQGFLLLTRDPVQMVLLKALLMFGSVAWLLVDLARRLEWNRWPLLLVFASPYYYMYGRALWDNVWLIPVSLALVWALVAFLQQPCWRWWGLLLGAAVLAGHIHLMAALSVGPALLVAGWYHRAWLSRHRGGALAILGVAVALCLPYAWYVLRHLGHGPDFRAGPVAAALGLAAGARLFTFLDIGHYLPEFVAACSIPPLRRVLQVLTILGLLLAATGLVLTIRELAGAYRRRAALTLAQRLGVYVLLVLGANLLFYALLRPQPELHYANAVWFASFFCLWRGANALLARPWGRPLVLVYGGAMGLLLALMIGFIHEHGGNRWPFYGPALSEQLAVVRQMVRHSPVGSTSITYVDNWREFPHALTTLLLLTAAREPGAGRLPPARFYSGYANPRGFDGHLALRAEPLAPAAPASR